MTICWRIGKKSLIQSKQTPDPSVQFLVNMQTTDKFNADEQLRIGYNGFKFDLMASSFMQDINRYVQGQIIL